MSDSDRIRDTQDDDTEFDETGNPGQRLSGETDFVVEALLSHALTVRGPDLSLSRRVVDRADAIAYELGLSDDERAPIRKAAVLRDVGRAGIPERILKKSGPLTQAEYDQVRSRLLPEDDLEDSEPVRAAIQLAYHHHERFDGTGYPDQLRGDEIPMGSRVLAVAEAYEAMMMDAAYRPAKEPRQALTEIVEEAGAQFDPAVVEALQRTVASGRPGWSSRRLSKNRPEYLGRSQC